MPRDRERPSVGGQGTRRFADEERRVLDSGEGRPAKSGLVDHVPTGVPQRDQMSGEISAVDRGHVFRVERTTVFRVVPVVEVATEVLEPGHRSQRGLESLHGVHEAKPAEITSGHGGQQIQPEIRGRRAVRDDQAGIFLDVVGRQAAVFGTHERREELPRSSRDHPERSGVLGRQRRGLFRQPRKADPSSHRGRRRPEQKKRQGKRPGAEAAPRDDGRRRSGQREPACHASIEAVEIQAQTRLGLGRGDPLEQVATGHAHPYERPHDGIAHEPRLVGEHRDRERRL